MDDLTELVGQADAYMQGYEAAKRDQLKERLKESIDVCSLLGEAYGMLNGLVWQINFTDEDHKNHVEVVIKDFADKVNKFVEGNGNE